MSHYLFNYPPPPLWDTHVISNFSLLHLFLVINICSVSKILLNTEIYHIEGKNPPCAIHQRETPTPLFLLR